MSGVKGRSGRQPEILNPGRKAVVTAHIQTSKILKRFQNHFFGHSGIELSQTQIKAGEILLRKTLPDLRHTEHSGEIGIPAQQLSQDDLKLRLTIAGFDADEVMERLSSNAIN